MSSNQPGNCCTVGVKHEGEPTGKSVKVASKHEAYIASPPADNEHKDVALLYIPDVIGIYKNSQLMADQFAANGYHTMIIDLFEGDAIPLNKPGNFDFMKWMTQGSDGSTPHTKESVDPIVEAAIKYLQDVCGAKRIGALGYCFGAKYVARHYKGGIDVGYMAHPSFVDDDELANISGPLSISAAETDSIFPAEKRHKSEVILQKAGHPYQIYLFSGVAHGFAVRGDPKKKMERFAKEQAFLQAVTWFNTWLL